jgi:hypothetical protein
LSANLHHLAHLSGFLVLTDILQSNNPRLYDTSSDNFHDFVYSSIFC